MGLCNSYTRGGGTATVHICKPWAWLSTPAYNRLFGSTLGTSARVPLGKGVPAVEFSAAQTTSLTSKSVTDWHHEQTQGTQYCHNNMSATFSWTLENLGGFPFDPKHPSYPKNSKRSSLPFNRDGSGTFTNQAHPDTITWTLAPDLEGTMVAWCISMEVFMTILNIRSPTSAGKTLKFCFPMHVQHKLSSEYLSMNIVLK